VKNASHVSAGLVVGWSRGHERAVTSHLVFAAMTSSILLNAQWVPPGMNSTGMQTCEALAEPDHGRTRRRVAAHARGEPRLPAPHGARPPALRSLLQMAKDPIVFAMANPIPEIMPEDAEGLVSVMATGRSDYPNQINNVLCFPGIFRGALNCRASRINEAMKLAAANAIAEIIGPDELHPDYIIPSVFDRRVADAVAEEVEEAAYRSKVARRHRQTSETTF